MSFLQLAAEKKDILLLVSRHLKQILALLRALESVKNLNFLDVKTQNPLKANMFLN